MTVFAVENIRNKEEGVYASRLSACVHFNTHESVWVNIRLMSKNFILVPEVIKICHFMRSFNGFKTAATYITVCFRCTARKDLIGYFAGGSQRIFTAMMVRVAYEKYHCHYHCMIAINFRV